MASNLGNDNSSASTSILDDRKTIVTSTELTNAYSLKVFMEKIWNITIEKCGKHVKILIICGATGGADGSINKKTDVSSLDDLKVGLQQYILYSRQLSRRPNSKLAKRIGIVRNCRSPNNIMSSQSIALT